MVDQITPVRVLNPQERSVNFHRRKNRRSRANPSSGLSVTHNLGLVTATVDNARFPIGVRSRPVTFSSKIQITGAGAAGLVFELGSSTTGIALSLNGSGVLQAGAGSAVANDGVSIAHTDTALFAHVGARVVLVLSVNPGSGVMWLWVDGTLKQQAQSVNGQFPSSLWADAGNGSVGSAANGTATPRVTNTGAPTGFVLVEPVRAFVGQSPRQS